jgi:hypothetical protein
MRIPPSTRGRRSRDGDVGAGFLLLVFVARDVAEPSSSLMARRRRG